MPLISTRLALFSLAVVVGAQATAQSLPSRAQPEPTRVVFVCEHGSVKSLIAMEYFNRKARERGLPFRAIARGTASEPTVPAPVRKGLQADGFEVAEFVPQLFRASDTDNAALVVSFDQDITKTVDGVRHVKWDHLPQVMGDYARGRDAIVGRVNSLVDELARRAPP